MRKLAWIVGIVAAVCGVTWAAYITTLPNMPTTSKLGWKWYSTRIIANGAAGDATRNLVVFTAPCNGKLRGVQYTSDVAITGTATHYRRFNTRVSNAAGTAVTVASIDWDDDLDAVINVPTPLYEPTLIAPTAMVRGGAVIVQDSLVGSGLALPAGLISVLFEGTN